MIRPANGWITRAIPALAGSKDPTLEALPWTSVRRYIETETLATTLNAPCGDGLNNGGFFLAGIGWRATQENSRLPLKGSGSPWSACTETRDSSRGLCRSATSKDATR